MVGPGGQAPSMSTNDPSRLLEREHQLSILERLLRDVADSARGRLVLIGGEAGVGKTALVRRFCDAHALDLRVLSGCCDALHTPRPLGAVLDIAQAIGGEIEDLAERGGRPYEIAAALMRALRARAPT